MNLMRIFKRLQRVLAFIKLAWQTEDYDYAYSLMIFKFSLLRLATAVENGYGIDGKYQARDIRRTCAAIQRILDDDYDKYVETELIDPTKLQIGFLFSKEPFRMPTKAGIKRMVYLNKQDWDYVNKMLKTKMQTWWD